MKVYYTFVDFTEFVAEGFIDESLDGLPVKGNIDTLVNAITQDAVDFFNLDDDDQTHYENARELDILKDLSRLYLYQRLPLC